MSCKHCGCILEKSSKEWGWRCGECIKKYRSEYIQKRKKKGLPTGGKRPPKEWWSKYNNQYKQRDCVRKRKADLMKQYLKDPMFKFKQQARWAVNKAIKAGKLFREECSRCGAVKSEAHHPDYNKPLLIIWLCRDCHVLEHKAKGE